MTGTSPATWIGAMATAFALGSLPIGLWWGRLARGIDVRTRGSRNLGATNVYRVLGPAHGIAVLVLDVAKGAAAVALVRACTGSGICALAAALAAVLGHVLSPWVGFKGGKGVATGLGVWLVLAPAAAGITLGLWGIALAISRRVSVASLLATTALPFAVSGFGPESARLPRIVAAALVALLVWIRHRANLVRLSQGKEPPLWGAPRP